MCLVLLSNLVFISISRDDQLSTSTKFEILRYLNTSDKSYEFELVRNIKLIFWQSVYF